MSRLSLVTVVVDDYDRAIHYYTQVMGFTLLEDTPLDAGKRWVRVMPDGGGTALLLAQAANLQQREAIGTQAGGRVFLFLQTDDFVSVFQRMSAAGVKFREHPRKENYGMVAVFEDIYGNLWDLVQLNK
ncbi:VOC family protein [Marinicella sp. W31]|uniref:VOC family protein n=1 Tax=Marinicella sp. W31 TaxID=3023713 RepID=UPI003757857D